MKTFIITKNETKLSPEYEFRQIDAKPAVVLGSIRIFESEIEPTLEQMVKSFESSDIPASIANWRAKAIIAIAGLTEAVENAIQLMPEPQKTITLSAWYGGAELARYGSTVQSLAEHLSLTSDQLDEMFRQAAELQI